MVAVAVAAALVVPAAAQSLPREVLRTGIGPEREVRAAVSPLAGGAVAAPYLVERYRSGGHVGGAGVRIARVFFGMPRGLAMWWALLKGSIRARTILL